MNPLTNVRNIQKLNQTELQLGTVGKKSWHDQYKDSAWIFVGGLPYDLTEGDILCVFSQYGEIVNMNLVRDKQTGKSKGFGFICYEDQRSTVLAVDNLNSIKLIGRIIRVDHVEKYKVPKEHDDDDDLTKALREEGCAPKIESSSSDEEEDVVPMKKVKKEKDPEKKLKKKKKKEKKKKKMDSSSDDERSHDKNQPIKVKKEKYDAGYDPPMRNSHTGFREQTERNGETEFRNRTNRPLDRGNDRGRNERTDGWRGRDNRDFRRGDNRDEPRREDFRRGDTKTDRNTSHEFRRGDYRGERQRDYHDQYQREDRSRETYRDRYDRR